jgi:hypothetical protein
MSHYKPYTNQVKSFLIAEEQMRQDFLEKAEEARQLYWEACKYPRKKKKKIRKRARAEYELYWILSQPVTFK